jgi:hypothetical protein
MRRLARTLLVTGAGVVASVFVATATSAHTVPASAQTPAPSGQSGSTVIPVDRQDYVADYTVAGTDPYDNDPSSIHVAISGGREFARSFVHLALAYLPQGSQATAATMTFQLTGQSDASNTGVYPVYDVNTSQAIIEACVLTSTLPADFNPSQPPGYSCAAGSSVGKMSNGGQTWTFDLEDLIPYWNAHGNTGAALVPVGSGESGQTWGVAFYKSRSTSDVTYGPAPAGGAAPAPESNQPATGTATIRSGLAAPAAQAGAAPVATTPTGASSAAAPAAQAGKTPAASTPAVPVANQGQPTQPQAPQSAARPQLVKVNGGGLPVWPWVLLGCLALAFGAVGFAHRSEILAAIPRAGAIWRTHPRAYAVAAAAMSWGLVFGAYSAATTSSGRHFYAATTGALPSGSGATGASGNASQPGTNQSGIGGSGLQSAPSSSGGGASGVATANVAGATTAGAQSGPSTGGPAEFSGAGTWETIDNTPVFFPAGGGTPEAQLYSGADNTIGITPNQIKICAHAALTYGSAFHISASDLNVYWEYVNAHGGIFNRQVNAIYENDNYDPGTAVQAAQTCKDWGTFFLLGGIGFDQIPAVRQWAEQNQELYIHHIATIEGSQGLRYSFSGLPTVEQMGTDFGELADTQFAGKKIGIMYRDSSNWTPGVQTFTQTVDAAGGKIVGSYGVQINQGNYEQEITQLRAAGVQVVFAWENALATVEMIEQADAQNWHPAWLVFPFNLETQTLGSNALSQDIWGAAAWDAYDPGYYGGGFSSYADQIHEFESEYKQYDPSADLSGDGGDLLFLNWEGQKWLDGLLTSCGPDCTRNKLAGLLLAGYNQTVPPNCPINFGRTSDHHHGGYAFNIFHQIKDPNGRANFVPVARCVTSY